MNTKLSNEELLQALKNKKEETKNNLSTVYDAYGRASNIER